MSPQVSFFSCKDNTLNVLLVTSSSIDRFKLNRGLLLLVISGKKYDRVDSDYEACRYVTHLLVDHVLFLLSFL